MGEIAAAVARALSEPAGREGVGGTAPHRSDRHGPSFPLPPPLHRSGLGRPQILSPPWHRHRGRDTAAAAAAAAWLGRGPVPQAPRPIEVWAGKGWEEVGGGRWRGPGWGEMGPGGPSGDRVAGERGLSGRMGAARAGDGPEVEGLPRGPEPGESREGSSGFGTGGVDRGILERGFPPFRFPSPSAAFWPHTTWVAVRRPGLLPRNAVRHPLTSRHRTTHFSAAFPRWGGPLLTLERASCGRQFLHWFRVPLTGWIAVCSWLLCALHRLREGRPNAHQSGPHTSCVQFVTCSSAKCI